MPVPPGFTIITEVCNIFFDNDHQVPAEVDDADLGSRSRSSRSSPARSSATPSNPLLLSVRSGAKFSMPGMMNTILNLGLNDETIEGLVAKTGNPRFAYDCYRRFIQMFGEVALGIEMEQFDEVFDERKTRSKRSSTRTSRADDLKAIIADYKKIVRRSREARLPAGPARTAHACPATPCSVPGGRRRLPTTARWRRSTTASAPPQHSGDGVRQHGRHLGTGVGFTRDPGYRREGFLRRIPGQRAG